MAFAFVSAASAGLTGSGSNSHSTSVTIPSCDLFIILAWHEGLNSNSPTAPTTATVNGVAATAIAQTPSGDQNAGWIKMFYYLTPPTGAQTVAVSGASGAGGGNSTGFLWSAYTGFQQSSQPDSSGATNDSSTTSMTLTTTVGTSNCVLIAGIAKQNTTGLTYTGLSARVDVIPENSYSISDSNGTVGTGSQSGTLASSPAQHMNGIIAAFKLQPATVKSGFFMAAGAM